MFSGTSKKVLPSDIAGLIPWLPTTLVIGLAQRTRELPAIRAVFSQILSETLGMGAKLA